MLYRLLSQLTVAWNTGRLLRTQEWPYNSTKAYFLSCSYWDWTYWSCCSDESQQRFDDALGDDIVSALRAVPCDVAQCPHCLLTDMRVGGTKELDQQRNCSKLHYRPSLCWRAWGYVRQCPCSFKLHQGAIKERRNLPLKPGIIVLDRNCTGSVLISKLWPRSE